MNDPHSPRDRVAQLRVLFDESARLDARIDFARPHTAELFAIIGDLKREVNVLEVVRHELSLRLAELKQTTHPPSDALTRAANAVLEAYQSRFETGTGNYYGPIDEAMAALRAAVPK